jgi:hypothetical protein
MSPTMLSANILDTISRYCCLLLELIVKWKRAEIGAELCNIETEPMTNSSKLHAFPQTAHFYKSHYHLGLPVASAPN